ncbi:putative ABC transporter C family member 15 [Bidens hawaiensis]|uniref:putative ABC transporter C family member 15 n=1 Tax=Bidens hawaiensis TaxID=980011 RepID=UPI00404A6D4D
MLISRIMTGLKLFDYWEPWLQPSSRCLWESASIILQLGFFAVLLISFVMRLIKSWSNHETKIKSRETYPSNLNIGLSYKLSLACSILLLGTHIMIPLTLKTGNQDHCKLEFPILSSEIMQIVSWVMTLIALYMILKHKIVDFPWILRTWWLCTFLLTASRFTLDVYILFSHHYQPRLPEFIHFIEILASTLLLFLALRGRTGFALGDPTPLTEPFLDRDPNPKQHLESKRECPYGKASFFQLVTFSWLNPLFVAGNKKPLDQDEVPYIDTIDSGLFTSEYFDECLKQVGTEHLSIYQAIYIFTRKKIAINALFAITSSAAAYVGPLLINDLVSFLSEKKTRSLTGGYLIAAGFLSAKFIETLTQRQWIFGARQLGLRLRAALISHIYKKGLVLSSRSCQAHTSGEIINIMSVDIQRITDFMWYINTCFMLPIQISSAMFILYINLGMGSFVGLAAMIILMSGNIPLTRAQKWYQSKIMEAKDARMKSTSEVLRNIKTLKLQAWDTHYLKKLQGFRKAEYDWLWKSLKLNAAGAFIFWGAPSFISVLTFGGCVLMGIPLTAGRVLSALATFRMLQDPIFNLPDLLNVIAQGKVSADRVASYLQEEEIQSDTVEYVSKNLTEFDVKIENGRFSWDPDSRNPNLDQIQLQVKRGMKVAICGTVGSGKSSLLSCILGEMPKLSGTVKISGSKAYVPQSAWILTGNIRENILFGKAYDKTRYENTIKACALSKDFELFSTRDLTEIGERGINMSGGQKQRIQIARAVYDDADIYLLDDPFSAVDAHTGTKLFQKCLLGMLTEKTVLYVTHQVEFLPAADLILVMQNGRIAQSGTFKELLSQNIGFEVLVGAHDQALEAVQAVESLSRETEQTGDEESTLITELTQTRQDSDHNLCVDMPKKEGKLIHEEEREKGSIGKEVYWAYLTLAKGGVLVPFILLAQSSFQLLQIASNYWMALACPADSTEIVNGMGFILLVYTLLAVGSAFCILLRASLVAIAGLLTSEKLFNNMLNSVFRAPMAFFDSTPTGRILNRASTDQSVIDLEMANRIGWCAFSTIQLLGTMAVMSQVAWEVFAILIPVTGVCIWYQRYYLPTARELARLAGIERSPILHHFAESLTGAATIRAFRQQNRFIERNLCLIDNHSRPWFHNVAAIEWLCFRLNQLSNFVFAFSLVLLVTLPDGIIDPSIAGLAVTYGINLNVQQASVIWNICNAENKMISVERVLQYSKLTSEAPLVIEDSRPPKEWPEIGTISFTNLQIRYADHLPSVLKNITCTFPGKKKVGVVGRTGSGKSTLIQAIFRVVEPTQGFITIDGVDICKIGLHDLRSRLSVIPQDPAMFEGTVRGNLDPLNQYPDAEIWEALDKCQLGDVVREKDEKLEYLVVEGGENWSVGQRQLFCLGRALLKKSSILVLDEATASIDSATDGILQKIIAQEFSERSIVTIAHRIHTVIDSDLVLVLSDGKIAEYDTPGRLLESENSFFSRLIKEYSMRSNLNKQ